jgi:hypothetical protein
MRLIFRLAVGVIAFFALGAGSASAQEKVWVGLYLAENGPPPEPVVFAPEKLTHRLRAVFGFKHYDLVKAQEIELGHEWEQWFVPRRDFFLRLEPLRRLPGEPRRIDYEIYKDGFIVAKGKYQPRRGTPLFINGPDFHDGRFIFVLEARPDFP